LDAKVERIREPGGVCHKALVIAYGVHESGRREVIGLDVGEAETEAFWRAFLRGLPARGLDGVRLCSSDAHAGLKNAIAQVLGCAWQRCTVHFLRDMRPHTPKVARLLEDAEVELLAFYAFPAEHGPKLRSTNPLERVNREIGRRSDVVGSSQRPSATAAAGMLLIEQHDEWLVGRRYLSESSMALVITTGHPIHPPRPATRRWPAHRVLSRHPMPTITSYTTNRDLTEAARQPAIIRGQPAQRAAS
jgi:putative transposase